jgi:hypothetical protein
MVYPSQFYNRAATLESALTIPLAAGELRTGINAEFGAGPPVDPQVIALRKLGASTYELDFIGTVGARYQLQQSLTLSGWSPVGTPFTCASGVNIIPVTSAEPRVFWRFESVP